MVPISSAIWCGKQGLRLPLSYFPLCSRFVLPLCRIFCFLCVFLVPSYSLSVLLVFQVHVPFSVNPFLCPFTFVGGATLYNDHGFIVGVVSESKYAVGPCHSVCSGSLCFLVFFTCPYSTLNLRDVLGWQLRVSQQHGKWKVLRLAD